MRSRLHRDRISSRRSERGDFRTSSYSQEVSKELTSLSSPPQDAYPVPSVWIIAVAVLAAFVIGIAALFDLPRAGVVVLSWATIASFVVLLLSLFRRQRRAVDSYRVSCHRDLHQWQQRWQLLHRETRQNASALLQLTDGVVVLGTNESVLLINPSAVRLLDLKDSSGLLGRSFTELVRVPELASSLRVAVLERQPQEFTLELQQAGGIRPVRFRIDLIDSGDADTLQLSLRDETEQRRVEEMRREFIANVSHELKTPLAAIKGYAETTELAIADDPEMAIHFLTQITSQCFRLERLVNEMMQLARAQSGRDHLHLASVSLSDVIFESIRTYEPVAAANDQELIFEPVSGKEKVLADREATLTIANNLIGNAVRYTPRGGKITVTVRSEQRGEEKMWAIVVDDTGVGIPVEDQRRIFERFYRGSKNAENNMSSTGLGLAIVKNLAQAQHGDVQVRSQPGVGSTFWVRLPAVVQKKSMAKLSDRPTSSQPSIL